ncbi:hypothetical protein P0R31_39465 [Bradyrhizobium yuanmingense]|uniref:hypothetical protein n=1 Tax=Bradyrhizobium yuanmingense TaxID=108015 RepID=UPI0023B9CDFC|nr:hypothetical protein [Bradyrhizobium yuanmingense]MDF0523275.1 hypothetical protein [Bradyrhizobium yuanmingense]
MGAVHVWNPDDWEAFALCLLQSRHGALNVHKIPAAHKGDLGLDYICVSERVAYQCYAVQEPLDISTRAERQKTKITIDIGKLVANSGEISKLFLGNKIKHWILLVPLHDSKDVNLHCAKKTTDTRNLSCSHLDANFEVGIHDQDLFATKAVAAGIIALNTIRLNVPPPTVEELKKWQVGSADLVANATHKLAKRTGPKGVQDAVGEAAKSFLQGRSVLDALRSSSPDLHEQIISVVANHSRRLNFAGPKGGPAPTSILNTEIDTLIDSIATVAPNLSNDLVQHIALGAISEWIMRCPLDF